MLREALTETSALIDGIIGDDDYPAGIEPPFLRTAVRDYPMRGGKRLRPALLLWSCGLLDGDSATAKYAAAAVEIYHNWTLVHDDIIDNDDLRRGRPSCHCQLAEHARQKLGLSGNQAEEFGRDFALLAGDLQQGWAISLLLRSTELGVSPELIIYLAKRLQQLVNRQVISGEALDIEFCFHPWEKLTPEQIEAMIAMKTSAILRFSAETGALIALGSADFADDDRIRKVAEAMVKAGIAFQLTDDWLGIFGKSEKLGKPIGSDLVERKPTLLLLHTWQRLEPEQKKQLQKLIGKVDISQEEINVVKHLIRDSGAEDIILKRAKNLCIKAEELLQSYPDNQYRQLLLNWIDLLINRDS